MTRDPKLLDEDALPTELADLLRDERTAPGPDAGAEARVLGRLEQTLGLPPGGGDGGGSSGGGHGHAGTNGANAAAAGISKAAATAAVVLALGVGAAVGAVSHAGLQAPPVPRIVVRTVVSVVRVTEAPSAATAAVPAPSASTAGTAPAPSARARAASSAPERSDRDRALAEENALIARAQAALSRGNAAQARAALREHESRFPSGQLTTERELLETYTERLEKGTP